MPEIVRYPSPGDLSELNTYTDSIPKYNPNSSNPFEIDLRSADLSRLDLSNDLESLLYSDFDSKTKWPLADKLPAEFDIQKIIECGKDPGLGIRFLHQKGITGAGIGIAIIDQTLLVEHVEYKDQIQVYEEDGNTGDYSMHGPAVASIAVGKTVGVAPDADLYFVATTFCDATPNASVDFACPAKNVRRIIEINKGLPESRKIRVLSMSIGWTPESIGYDEITAAVNEAKSAGIFVISMTLSDTYGWKMYGMGRDPLANPNQFDAYRLGAFWAQYFYNGTITLDQTLLIPMDARATASPTGYQDYVFYGIGGMSWTAPYLAGMYALTAQVKPGITPEEFWSTAMQTGKTTQIQYNGKSYSFGTILDPQAMIAALQE